MDKFEKKNRRTARGVNYTYYYHAGSASLPTLLMLHGFPDSAHLWDGVVPSLVPLGFSILVPDCLGYGGTDKPLDLESYSPRLMSKDMMDLLDAEGAADIVSIGHDFGSTFAQRVYTFYPDRVKALVTLAVAYRPQVPAPFDIQTINRTTEEKEGYPRLAYWEFFSAPGAGQIILSHLESFWCVMHGSNEHWMRDMFCTRGAMQKFLEADGRCPLRPFAQDDKAKEAFFHRLRTDGVETALNWYKTQMSQIVADALQGIDPAVYTVNKPYLFIGSVGDEVCRTADNEISVKGGYLPFNKVVELHAGHWTPLEKPGEVGEHIRAFLAEHFVEKASG